MVSIPKLTYKLNLSNNSFYPSIGYILQIFKVRVESLLCSGRYMFILPHTSNEIWTFSFELTYNRCMKKLFLFVLLSLGLTAISFADGVDDWQDLDFNINKLNELNQCMSCDLRSTNFSGLNFTGANLTGANFIEANLTGTNFYGANFEGSSLYGSNFEGANLEDASFFAANLYGVILKDARLIGADFRQADLSKADLTLANLTGANLTDANLSGAKLKGAILDGAFFCNTQTPWGIDNSSCQ